VRALACAAPKKGWDHLLVQLGENQKLAHLFMICSNIKLTWAGESIGIGG
jgi:hypothetical protein